jgi:hypothetical protein
LQRRAQIELDARDAAQERTAAAFPDFATPAGQRAEAAQAEYRKNLADERRKRLQRLDVTGQVGEPLKLAAPPLVLPPFRPTRVRQVPVYEGPLAEPVRYERRYLDPDTGDLRPPTAGEELVEAFAQQPVMTEEQARRRGEELAAQRQAIAEARAAGRPLPEFERPEAMVSGVLSRPMDTGAIVETPLAATMRGGLGALSAAVGEGIGALTADVDPATGEFLEPESLAAKAALARRVAAAMYGMPVEEAAAGEGVGVGLLPTPGMTTERASRVPEEAPFRATPSPTDPEQRRVASQDPEGLRRLARNITVGRGLGDEFSSSPDLRQAYARVFGDEDAAWWAGTLAEMAIPVGPGAAAKTSQRLGTFLGKYAPILSPTQNLIRFADSVDVRAINTLTDWVAAASRTPQADARLTKRVAEQIVRREGIVLGQQATDAALAAIKASDGRSADEVARAVSRAIGEDPDAPIGALRTSAPTYLRMQEAIVRNTPGDFVMVTDAVAAPRAAAPAIREAANRTVATIVERDAPAIAGELRRIQARVAGTDAALAAQLGRAADDIVQEVATNGLDAATATARGSATRSLVERAARALDEDPRAAGQLYTRSSPDEVARAWAPDPSGPPTPVASLRGLTSWDDVDPQTLRLALEEIRSLAAVRAAPGVATASRRLSDLQKFVARADNPKALDTMVGRRLRAMRGQAGQRAPLSVEAARENIRATTSAAFRTTGKVLDEMAAQYRSVDKALDEMTEMASGGEAAESVWKRVLPYLYAGEPDALWAAVSPLLRGSQELPTVQRLLDLDRQLVAAGIVKGWDGLNPASFIASTKSKENVQLALLKNFMEESVVKGLAAAGREAEAVGQGILRAEDDAMALAGRARPPGLPLAPQADSVRGVVRQYDTAASDFENMLAQHGEMFSAIQDSVPVMQRAGFQQLAQDLGRAGVTWARNAVFNARYGYAVPNLPLVLGRLVQAPVISLATIGVQNTARALGASGPTGGTRESCGRRMGPCIPRTISRTWPTSTDWAPRLWRRSAWAAWLVTCWCPPASPPRNPAWVHGSSARWMQPTLPRGPWAPAWRKPLN